MSENKKEFIPGLYVKPPHEKAPDYVKLKLSMKRVDLLDYLSAQTDEYINIDVKEAKSGKWYCERDNWKPDRAKHADPEAFYGAGAPEKPPVDMSESPW